MKEGGESVNFELIERVRMAIYDGFAVEAHAASQEQIQVLVDTDEASVTRAIKQLAADHHLVADPAGHVVMAHPFSSMNLGFSVMGDKNLWWGGCAWDSFAIPHLVPNEPRVLVATTCPGCLTPLAWHVSRSRPPNGTEVAHFLVPMAACWDDVVHSCSNQRLYCSEVCVERWLVRMDQPKGYVMDLATLWALASEWYTGRLDSPYVRRDPELAKDYFRSVGLHGAFWGLDD
jgi:hypothetical protein